MSLIRIGIVGAGNVGSGVLEILTQHAASLKAKLGFSLIVSAICRRNISGMDVSTIPGQPRLTTNWEEVAAAPDVDVVCELVGGTTVARQVIETALREGKPVITANKELMALHGPELSALAKDNQTALYMEASVAGGIPIHAVLREGIAADEVQAFLGILNGTSNYILTEIEAHGAAFDSVLAEAQRLGYAEADPTADIEGFDARSKLALLSAIAFGQAVEPSAIFCEGITRITPLDFEYAHTLGHTIRLLCHARLTEAGLALSVRPTLLPKSTILAGVQSAYNAIWVCGKAGRDTFYYGRGAGPLPTGVAVVSDIMRAARELQTKCAPVISTFSYQKLSAPQLAPSEDFTSGYYLRFRVHDATGIIAALGQILSQHGISIDAVLQLPNEDKDDLPFVITVEPARQAAIAAAVEEMKALPFLVEAPLALPLEKGF